MNCQPSLEVGAEAVGWELCIIDDEEPDMQLFLGRYCYIMSLFIVIFYGNSTKIHGGAPLDHL